MQIATLERHTAPRDRDALVNDQEAAEILALSRSWLKQLRVRGGGPPYLQLGGKAIRYKVADLFDWADSKKVTSTSAAL